MMINKLQRKSEIILKKLIETPSLSTEEKETADFLEVCFTLEKIPFERKANNLWARNKYFDPKLPTILLNSHHDTVAPNSSYSRDPFEAYEEDGKIYGLGSNDAGASLVGLWASFVFFYRKRLPYNLIFAATAEEEISGENGFTCILEDLGEIDFALVGEPTQMQMAVAEKGLVVLDCVVKGTASHAAHSNSDNSIYKALKEIEKVRKAKFEKYSTLLGEVKSTVTMVSAGHQHNVVPDQTNFTIDVRTNEHYQNEEVEAYFDSLLDAEVKARSLRLNSSKIDLDHPIVLAAKKNGHTLYGSPTISDQSLMPFDSVKMGIGDSTRSHSADEFIFKSELYSGIEQYIGLFTELFQSKTN